ncbi:hypothetical protein QBC44DRAFT_396121 [Cladorrhinum sp. PSN332]|nr:hypothetical protein QBC44DRAFT_396121 [Cladorrhinum sp. PSN332]
MSPPAPHNTPTALRPQDLDNLNAAIMDNNSYVSPPGHKNEPVPVISDSEARNEAEVEAQAQVNNSRSLGHRKNQNSAAQLDRNDDHDQDDLSTINTANILSDSKSNGNGNKPATRGAGLEKGGYREPGDNEGLPENDGRSRVGQ